MDVCLVTMPFGSALTPSLSLGVLKAGLARRGIDVGVVYANLLFAERMGIERYQAIFNAHASLLCGEYVFTKAAFAGYPIQADYFAYIESQLVSIPAQTMWQQLGAVVTAAREEAGPFIADLSAQIIATGASVVGVSSVLHQHSASLALLRQLKRDKPDMITVLGGANCEASMGAAVARHLPWVDFVVSGEADDFFSDFCSQLLTLGLAIPDDQLPYGVIRQGTVWPNGQYPRRVVQDMQTVAAPDYDDYFATLKVMSYGEQIEPGLLLETSRGCWWGEKSACTFCGLNGQGRTYRTRPAAAVVEEAVGLAAKYQTTMLEYVDNIIAIEHVRPLLERLAKSEGQYKLFFETKSNLTQADLKLLAAAGARIIQPGIESLHDDVLTLMRKGNTAIKHVELLKNCAICGISPIWHMLCCFPGEQPAWYGEMAEWLECIYHLQPPVQLLAVLFQRFSHYHNCAAEYGLTLKPLPVYQYILPDIDDFIAQTAYTFTLAEPTDTVPAIERQPEYQLLWEKIKSWQQSYAGSQRERLIASDNGSILEIMDLRACACRLFYRFEGLPRAIYKLCERAMPRRLLEKSLQECGHSADSKAIDEAVAMLKEARLLLELSGQLLALALPDTAVPIGRQAFPGGKYHPAKEGR